MCAVRTSGVSSASAPLKMKVSLKRRSPCPRPRPRCPRRCSRRAYPRAAEVLERVDEPPDVVVGVLEEAGVDLHLPGRRGLEILGHVVPGRYLLVPRGQLRVRGRDFPFVPAGLCAPRRVDLAVYTRGFDDVYKIRQIPYLPENRADLPRTYGQSDRFPLIIRQVAKKV